MSEGYAMLERGDFIPATKFFKKILTEYPTNKTANICYGRAIGLNGKTRDALVLFVSLKETHPKDIEVSLNLAEAHMWNKNYVKAENIYKEILIQNPQNFTAQLGISNAYASQLKNVEAHQHIKEAIAIDSKNASAKISKKYILLALAEDSKNAYRFDQALRLLDSVNTLFPYDREALLNKAICYLWMDKPKKASENYLTLKNENIDVFEALMGLSYTSTLLGQKSKALVYAQEALNTNEAVVSKEANYKRAALNLINCLAIKGNFKQANKNLNNLIDLFGPIKELKASQARLVLWQFKAKEALAIYEELNKTYPNDFEILMGLVESNRSLKKYKTAINYIDEALEVIPQQADAIRLRNEIESLSKPNFYVDAFKSNDVANNKNTGLIAKASFGSAESIRSTVHMQLYTLSNPEIQEDASQYMMKYQLSYPVNHRLDLKAGVQPTLATNNENFKKRNFLFNGGADFRINKFTSLAYYFEQEAFNFNVQLLKSGIGMNHHKVIMNTSTKFGTGLFAQYIFTKQTDKNRRNLFSASLYHNILKNPILQTGLNYTSISFDFSSPSLYFSPLKYSSYEAFLKLNNFDFKRSKILYHALIAFGKQASNDEQLNGTIRIEGDLGYRINRNIQLLIYYRYSSLDQSTAVGYTWNALGFKTNINF